MITTLLILFILFELLTILSMFPVIYRGQVFTAFDYHNYTKNYLHCECTLCPQVFLSLRLIFTVVALVFICVTYLP